MTCFFPLFSISDAQMKMAARRSSVVSRSELSHSQRKVKRACHSTASWLDKSDVIGKVAIRLVQCHTIKGEYIT